MKEKIIVSACLLGENCKYNGGNNFNEKVTKLSEKYEIIPVCPEILAGLSVPRARTEINGERVFTMDGDEVTEKFILAANKVLEKAKENNVKMAVLKSKSPSCGKGIIYDGTFSGRIVDGNGITASVLLANNIKVLTEDEI